MTTQTDSSSHPALALDAQVFADNVASERIAFDLGWDYAFYGQVCLLEDPQVQHGYAAGKERFGRRTTAADRFVRKWLSLRASAWRRQRVFSDAVTPDYLRKIDVERCPILGIELTHGTLTDTDWSIDRVNNEGAYAPGNLAVMSTRANKAKGALTLEGVVERLKGPEETDGLTHRHWLAMASLMAGPCLGKMNSRACLMYAHRVAPDVPTLWSQVLQFAFLVEQRTGAFAILRQIDRHCLETTREREFLAALVKKMRKREKHRPSPDDFWADSALFDVFSAWFRATSFASHRRIIRLINERVRGMRGDAKGDVFAGWSLETSGYYEGRDDTQDPEPQARVNAAA